ncbi:MAG: hypothetical protein ACE5MG_07305, partial [Candidatus Methylomirabilales bacterium]
AAVTLTIFVATPAFGGNLPSSKAAAASGYLMALGRACSDDGTVPGPPAGPQPCESDSSTDTGWKTVQRTYIKTPNAKDLVMNIAMQTGLVTFTEVKSKGGNKDTSKATASIHVRVRIYDVDSSTLQVIPGSYRYAYPYSDNPGINNPDVGVTYNSRTQVLSATFQGIIERCITAEGTIFIDDLCLDPEEVSLLLKTLSANSFNFIAANETSGIKQIDVQARAKANTALFDSQQGSAKGEAYVGLGSMLVETVRFVKDQDGGPEIQELQ